MYIKALKAAHATFLADGAIAGLLAAVQGLGVEADRPTAASSGEKRDPIRREDLRLICFDYVWS